MRIAGELRTEVTTEELVAQADQVRTAAKELQDSFDRMKSLIAQTENYWKGDAADAHRKGYDKNQTSIEEIVARYQEHVRDLEEMAGVYSAAEKQAADLADELPASTI